LDSAPSFDLSSARPPQPHIPATRLDASVAKTAPVAFGPHGLLNETTRLSGAFSATLEVMHGIGKRFVYVLRSATDAGRHYVGITSDPDRRLEWHNHGPCGHTVGNRPWSFVVVLEFPTEQQAVQFERYLKTGSGRAFASRNFRGQD
jgi:putative endonuclease